MQVAVEELVGSSAHRFVRHSADPASYDAAWVRGDAVVLRGSRHTLALGPPTELGPLLHDVAGLFVPARLTVEAAAYDDVPAPWRHRREGPAATTWHWMWTDRPAPEPDVTVVEVVDDAEVDAVLDAAMPTSHARPGTPGIEAWLGVRDGPDLVGVGAVRRDADGSGHLRGVCVLPDHAGRGLGTALSAGLTRRAMDRPPHVATLGVYVDNAAALAVYDRLGYAVAHTLVSGQVVGADG